MMAWLLKQWSRVYEGTRLYRWNPCDVDAARWFKPLGEALAVLGSHCPCCSGTRVLLALALGAISSDAALGVLLGWSVVTAAYVVWRNRNGDANE